MDNATVAHYRMKRSRLLDKNMGRYISDILEKLDSKGKIRDGWQCTGDVAMLLVGEERKCCMVLSHESIDKNSPIPAYYQIMNHLREKIEEGDYPVNSTVPPERELVEMYQVSRMTVRQAIAELVNEGILVRRKGIGTFVAPPKIEQKLSSLTSFTEDMAQRGMKAGGHILSFKELVPDSAIRKILSLSVEDTVFESVRLRLADEEPMALETTTLVASLCPELKREDLENQSLYKLLTERWDLQLEYATQSLEPILAPSHEAAILHVAPGAPLLLMHRVTHDQSGRAFEHVKSLYRGDRYKFITELYRNQGRRPISHK